MSNLPSSSMMRKTPLFIEFYWLFLQLILTVQFESADVHIELIIQIMKQLLNLARQKRQQEGRQSNPGSKIMLQKQEQMKYQFDDEEYDDDEEYEPDQQEIYAYAEYLGIKLPEEQDLLFIAREGLMADLPDDWANEEIQTGEIVYINLRTGQKTMEHPCDQYYKQLVIKERRKKGRSMGNKATSSGLSSQPISNLLLNNNITAEAPKKNIMDPLVKMQMEKKQKKLEEQTKKQYNDRKAKIRKKYQQKKQDLERNLKEKLNKQKEKYDREIADQRAKTNKKLSEQQKQDEDRRKKEIEKYQRDMRVKIDNKYLNIKNDQITKIEKQYRNKKETIRKQLENQLKVEKRQLEEEIKEKMRILAKMEEDSKPKQSYKEQFQADLLALKNSITERRLRQHELQLKESRKQHEKHYTKQINQLQASHELKVKEIEEQACKTTKTSFKLDDLMKQIEEKEKIEVRQFEYELKMMREIKQSQNTKILDEHRHKLIKEKQEALQLLNKQYQNSINKYKQMKQEEYEMKTSQAEKHIKQTLLSHIRRIKQKYGKQQQMIEMEAERNSYSKKQRAGHSSLDDKKSMEMMENLLDKLTRKQEKITQQIEAIRQQIKRLNSTIKPFQFKLNQQFIQQYNILKEKVLESGIE